jgi:TRAP-type C4-dicarboxylate transport system permease small subunit
MKIGAITFIYRLILSITIFIFTIFVWKKIKFNNNMNSKILNVLFYIIYSISLFIIIIMCNYLYENPNYIYDIQTIPFGKIHYLLNAGFTILTVPLIGIVIALVILLLNYRICKNNKIKNQTGCQTPLSSN